MVTSSPTTAWRSLAIFHRGTGSLGQPTVHQGTSRQSRACEGEPGGKGASNAVAFALLLSALSASGKVSTATWGHSVKVELTRREGSGLHFKQWGQESQEQGTCHNRCTVHACLCRHKCESCQCAGQVVHACSSPAQGWGSLPNGQQQFDWACFRQCGAFGAAPGMYGVMFMLL